MQKILTFLARLDEVGFGFSVSIGGGGGGSVSKKFNVTVFYVMSKALSGELSCPCDKSCFNKKYWYI